MLRKISFYCVIVLMALWMAAEPILAAPDDCTGEFISVSIPLSDLGNNEYNRLLSGPTGYTGGLYPNGANTPPAEHAAAGIEQSRLVQPLSVTGDPNPAGKVVLLSIGMSNTASEFGAFSRIVRASELVNQDVVLVNGAQPSKVATEWVDPLAPTWTYVDDMLATRGLSQLQVQVAWVKLTNYDLSQFPQSIEALQRDLAAVVHNLKTHYPNIRLAYLSSRTRSYRYWSGLNPEPGAYETGFAVKWLIEQQINADPELNYDPERGRVTAPWLAWGPYLWADGLNPRSDGLIWTSADLVTDCTHPSFSGEEKVASMLMSFFTNEPSAKGWFLEYPYHIYLPVIEIESLLGP